MPYQNFVLAALDRAPVLRTYVQAQGAAAAIVEHRTFSACCPTRLVVDGSRLLPASASSDQQRAQKSGGEFGPPEQSTRSVSKSSSEAGVLRCWREKNPRLPEQRKNSTFQ